VSTTPKKISQKWYWTAVLSALIGILLSLYLLVQHTRLKAGIQGGPSLCSLGGSFNCEVIDSSPYSEIGGIPLAGIGAVFFALCLFLLLTSPAGRRKVGLFSSLLVVLALAALGIDLILLGIQIFSIKSYCLFCLLTYVCNGLILVGTVQAFVPDGRFRLGKIKSAIRFTGEGAGASVPSIVMVVVGVLCVTTMVALFPSFIRTDAPQAAKAEDAMVQFFEGWKKQPVRNIEFKDGDGTIGNPASRVRVTVFSDFECPHCRKAAFTLNSALHPLKDRVFMVFKHFPLDSSCNSLLQYQLHAHACELARLGYCAKKKGKFWEFHDRVFLNMDEDDIKKGTAHIKTQLKDVFTEKEYDACQKDPAAIKNTEQDIKLGRDLGIQGTPSVFINGKKFGIPMSVENLQQLIEIEARL